MRIYWYDTLDSTNSEAERRLEALDNMSVIATKVQTAGRGQGDHLWHSKDSENLLFSIVFKPELELDPGEIAGLISPALCLGILDYLKDEGVSAFVKYPNDIWVNDKKLAGLLIKNTIIGNKFITGILGVGLNLNETDFPAELPNPVSLKALTGKNYIPEKELEALIMKICRRFDFIKSEGGRISLQEEFGKYVQIRLPEGL